MELDELKEKKVEELKKKQLEQQQQMEAEAKIASAARALLSDEARQRLNNVKLVNQELYLKTVQVLLYMANTGQMQVKLSEEELKALLEKLSAKREITIKRK